jgi:hypothetical protein
LLNLRLALLRLWLAALLARWSFLLWLLALSSPLSVCGFVLV